MTGEWSSMMQHILMVRLGSAENIFLRLVEKALGYAQLRYHVIYWLGTLAILNSTDISLKGLICVAQNGLFQKYGFGLSLPSPYTYAASVQENQVFIYGTKDHNRKQNCSVCGTVLTSKIILFMLHKVNSSHWVQAGWYWVT